MKAYYNAEIQMDADHRVSAGLITDCALLLGAGPEDAEDREDHRVSFFFVSDKKPSEIRKQIRKMLNDNMGIHYVDVIYRFEHEMNPDRFVLWSDGHDQEYTGHVVFTEDK